MHTIIANAAIVRSGVKIGLIESDWLLGVENMVSCCCCGFMIPTSRRGKNGEKLSLVNIKGHSRQGWNENCVQGTVFLHVLNLKNCCLVATGFLGTELCKSLFLMKVFANIVVRQ
jgi:hypothetical protein